MELQALSKDVPKVKDAFTTPSDSCPGWLATWQPAGLTIKMSLEQAGSRNGKESHFRK